jgi:MFS family permease
MFWIYILAFIGEFNLGFLTFVSILLAVRLGANTIDVGWISTAFGLTYALMPFIVGKISDHFSRKSNLLFITIAQTILISYYLLAARSVGGLILGQILYGLIYSMFWVNLDALISERTDHSPRQHHISFFNYCIGWTMGSGLAPFFGGIFADTDIIIGFLIVAGIYILGVFIVFLGFDNQKRGKLTPDPENLASDIENSAPPPKIAGSILLIVILFQTMLVKVIMAYFPNYAAEPTGLFWSGTLIGQVVVWFGVARVIFFIFGRIWENSFRWIPGILIALGIILLQFLWVDQPVVLACLFAFSGFMIAKIYITILELMLYSEKKSKGSKAGLFESVLGIGMSLTPVIAGWFGSLWLLLPFLIFGGTAIILGVALLIYVTRNKDC